MKNLLTLVLFSPPIANLQAPLTIDLQALSLSGTHTVDKQGLVNLFDYFRNWKRKYSLTRVICESISSLVFHCFRFFSCKR